MEYMTRRQRWILVIAVLNFILFAFLVHQI